MPRSALLLGFALAALTCAPLATSAATPPSASGGAAPTDVRYKPQPTPPPRGGELPPPVATPRSFGPLPARFAGMFPCADCAGVRWDLLLLEGNAFELRTAYLRDGQDVTYWDLGAWSLSPVSPVLTLRGARGEVTKLALLGNGRLRKLDLSGREIVSRLPYELERTERGEPLELRARMIGRYERTPDGGRFTECRSGLAWTVVRDGEAASVERAAGYARGRDLVVEIDGRLVPRGRGERGAADMALLVERFFGTRPAMPCEAVAPPPVSVSPAALGEGRWMLVKLGTRAFSADVERAPFVQFDLDKGAASGFAGCNTFVGAFAVNGATLRFQPLTRTKMYCTAMAAEDALFAAFDQTRGWRASGVRLDLLGEDGRTLASFDRRDRR